MVQVPWPFTSAPGEYSQEGAGRLINVFIEGRSDFEAVIWRRVPGAKIFARSPSYGTADGSAAALGVSQVVEVDGAAAGDSTVTGDGQGVFYLAGDGIAAGDSTATAEREVTVAVDGAAAGDSGATAVGTAA